MQPRSMVHVDVALPSHGNHMVISSGSCSTPVSNTLLTQKTLIFLMQVGCIHIYHEAALHSYQHDCNERPIGLNGHTTIKPK